MPTPRSLRVPVTRLTIAILTVAFAAGCTAAATPGTHLSHPVAGPTMTAYGVTAANELVRFNTKVPGKVEANLTIGGLAANETVVGLDFRSAATSSALYALGSTGRLYTLNVMTGLATPVGTGMATPLTGATQGFDFNPAADRLRIVSGTANRRAHPDTGAEVDADMAMDGTQLDGAIAYDATDVNAGQTPNLVAAAYSNPDADAATPTTNFAIDAARDVLVTQGTREGVTPAVSPNTGKLFTVGALQVDAGETSHLDIGRGQALAAIGRYLYTVDLASGGTRLVGSLAAGELRAFAIAP